MTDPARRPRRVLFVCVENSNRSQMAEAFARIHGGDSIEAYSAGSRPSGRINPKAVEAMREVGYDLTRHGSKGLTDIPDVEYDAAVTMGCGDACPLVRAKRREDWGIPDPRELSPEQFRGVRDLIEAKVIDLLVQLIETGRDGRPGVSDRLIEQVQTKYAAVAASGLSNDHSGVRAVAEAFGYSPDELASVPAEANMGLSCGNPTAFASLKSGEVVVDLGCGGGLDVLLAAARVGPAGKAIGIDMTPEMIDRARRNAARQGVSNVAFHLAAIDRLPLPDSSADCVISNCVINLAADKRAVFREIFRVLKPGGRVAVSDIALKRPLPEELARDILAYVACIAGAVPIEDYRRGLEETGFAAVQVVDAGKDLNAYLKVENQAGCCSPPMISAEGSLQAADCCSPSEDRSATVHVGLADLLRKYDVNAYAASVQVYALKAS